MSSDQKRVTELEAENAKVAAERDQFAFRSINFVACWTHKPNPPVNKPDWRLSAIYMTRRFVICLVAGLGH